MIPNPPSKTYCAYIVCECEMRNAKLIIKSHTCQGFELLLSGIGKCFPRTCIRGTERYTALLNSYVLEKPLSSLLREGDGSGLIGYLLLVRFSSGLNERE